MGGTPKHTTDYFPLLNFLVTFSDEVDSEGKTTKSGVATLSAIKNGALTPEAVSKKTGQPLFKVRSGLRELTKAELVEQIDQTYRLTPKAAQLLP